MSARWHDDAQGGLQYRDEHHSRLLPPMPRLLAGRKRARDDQRGSEAAERSECGGAGSAARSHFAVLLEPSAAALMISNACRSLLVESQRFATSYGSGLFNHLPMALLALDRLGGDEARLRQFGTFYEKRLHSKSPGDPLPNDDWRE